MSLQSILGMQILLWAGDPIPFPDPALRLQPDTDLRSVYDAYYQVYRSLYESAKGELHALAKLGAGTAS